jgi:hypothetical protein
MMEDAHVYKRKRRRLWLALALLGVLFAIVVIPPMVSISRYKRRITQLISESLGRPVRLSSVELRLLPVPGFVLTDLAVDEDPAFGAEPVLRANTVAASIRLLSLWRGRLEIGTISVEDASFNVVRTPQGRWNLDSLFRTAAAKTQPQVGAAPAKRAFPLPYIEATHSRVNFKQGAEKLPFSLVDTELSFWQDQPGDWSVRLRGQPARTDLSLDLADTGVVRLEATVQRAAELRQMPVHLDAEWREAQLGQLARLVIGSDPGWRGDLTGELHLDGTAEAAQIKTRLRATGVHRAEFAPAAPMDFDATCNLLYRYTARSVESLTCDSPLGDGRIRVAGALSGKGPASSHMSVELDRIPVAAGLDALRTVRSDFAPGLEAAGSISGKISYAPVASSPLPIAAKAMVDHRHSARSAKTRPAPLGPLTGSFTVTDFALSGDSLGAPIQVSTLSLVPILQPAQPPSRTLETEAPAGLETKVSLAEGGPAPLEISVQLALSGYQFAVHGQAAIARARELARLAGMANAASLDALAGEPVSIDLAADGPWMPAFSSPFAEPGGSVPPPAAAAGANSAALPAESPAADVVHAGDHLSGTITLKKANWRSDYLANHVEISQATLHLSNTALHWDPIDFSYGPVKAEATLDLPAHCDASQTCVPRFQVHFDELDASALQAAILGAHEPGTLLSTLLERLRPASSSDAPAWPVLEGTVTADSLILGPVTFTDASANLHMTDGTVEFSSLEADLLAGHVSGNGVLRAAPAGQSKPVYTLEGHFEGLNPAAVGALLGQRWSGRALDGEGKIELAGFTGQDLAASVKGTLHFDWRRGAIDQSGEASAETIPTALARFDEWSAGAAIAGGTITFKDSRVVQGSRNRAVEGRVTLGSAPAVAFTAPKVTQAQR